MLTHHFPPNQPSTSDTTSTPLQLPEIRRSMSIPNYKQLQETLTTAQQRANWLAPHWQLYQNLTIHHPTTRQYLQALDEAHLPNQEMLPDNVQQYLARAMATTGFPFSSIKSISHHTYQNKNIWRVALTKLPGSLQPQSMLQGVYKYAHATSQSGIIGFLLLGCILPSCKDILGVDFTPTGFFCSATLDPTPDALLKIVVNRSQSAKNSGSFIITGDVIGCHAVVDTGGVYDEQKTVQRTLITHRRKDKRWCVHHEHNHPTDLWFVHPDPITPTETPHAEASSHSQSEAPGATFYVQPTPPQPTILE